MILLIDPIDDQVIQHLDAQKIAGFFQSFRHGEIFGTWRQIAGWVVVAKDHRIGLIDDGISKDLPGMDDGAVDGPKRYDLVIDDTVLGIEECHDKGLLVMDLIHHRAKEPRCRIR